MPEENYDIWFEGVEKVSYPKIELPKETEIVIVGGGMAGITSAYLLAKAGKKVLLLEKGKIGGYVTSATTAFLTFTIDTEPLELIKKFGKENAKLILEAHKVAIDEVEKIIKTENIDCDFERCTNYIYANDLGEEKYLSGLVNGYNQLSIDAVFKKDGKLKFNDFGYVEMPNHGKFHALKYLIALSKLAVKYGAKISEDTEVLSIKDNKDSVEVEVKDAGVILAKKAVSAVYRPFKEDRLKHLTNMYVEYVIEYKLPKDKFVMGTYEDTREPYNYFRIDKKSDHDRLIIGGADHLMVLKLNREMNHAIMQKYAKSLFNNSDMQEVRHWSGSMLETNDGLAFIGETKGGNIFYIFGFSGNGMTYSYVAGKILLDHVMSIDNPYAKIFRVDRKISWWKNLFK